MALRGLALYSLLFSIVVLGSARDVSDISFENGGNVDPFNGYPQNFTAVESRTVPGTIMLQWDSPSNITGVIGYQVLYWRPTSSSYKYMNVTRDNTTAVIERLPGFTEYYFSVRSRLEDRFSLAVVAVRRRTISRAPDGVPMVKNYTSPYNEDYTQIRLYWSGINDSLWNGINNTYIVDMFDVTTDAATNNRGRYLIYRSPRDIYDLTVTSLTIEHEYLVYVYASSSGGLGSPSEPYRVYITSPTVTPTVQPSTRTWQFYVIIIPSVIGLAIFIAAIILCIKLCLGRNKRNVSYVRDINKNIEDGTVMNSRLPARFDTARLSNQNRPLPPNPHTPTPSAMSVNARLIKDYSPPFDHTFSDYPPGSYPHQQQHSHLHHQFNHHSHHHHPLDLGDPGPVMGMDTRMRANSATSPHYPTLSQPLSDMSSVTPTSVFAESSNPGQSQGLSQGHPHHHGQRFLSNRSPVSPTNPNPYEVPNESESGHHSVSPPGHHHTLPGTRRPLTANHSVGQFYPVSSSHPHHGQTSPFSQSDMFQFEAAPPVPPHRSTTNLGQGVRASPPDADYSEIPDDSPTGKPPPGGRYDNEGIPSSSPIQSDQYNSYSDIPTAVSPYNIGIIGGGNKEKMSPGHSSLSESISSFSTDSQSTSPARGAVGPSHGHMRGTNVSPSYRGRGNSQTNGSIPRSGSKSNQAIEPHRSPESSAPYLSPTSIKSSSNSDTRTTSPPSQ